MTKSHSSDFVLSCLPDEPDNYHYEVEQMSPLVQRVWLVHHKEYVYAEGEQVKTVWGFIKQGKVYPPRNFKTPQPKSVGLLMDAYRLPSYTTIIPKTTSLLHLL